MVKVPAVDSANDTAQGISGPRGAYAVDPYQWQRLKAPRWPYDDNGYLLNGPDGFPYDPLNFPLRYADGSLDKASKSAYPVPAQPGPASDTTYEEYQAQKDEVAVDQRVMHPELAALYTAQDNAAFQAMDIGSAASLGVAVAAAMVMFRTKSLGGIPLLALVLAGGYVYLSATSKTKAQKPAARRLGETITLAVAGTGGIFLLGGLVVL